MPQQNLTEAPILVVEGNADDRDILCEQLAALELSAVAAADADAAVKRFTEQQPEIVLIGTPAGEVDRYTLCRRLRGLSARQRIPIILIVPNETDETLQAIYTAEATDYLLHPVRPLILRQRVQLPLRARRIQAEMEQALRTSEERHRIISETISDYAYSYIVQEDGTLKKDWSTSRFHEITGYTFEEVDSNGWVRLIHPDDRAVAAERYMRLLGGEVDVSEFRIVTKSGKVRWLQDHGYPVTDPEAGRVVYIYGAAQDITRRKQDEQQLRQLAAQLAEQAAALQASNEELDAFAYTVAHDLKNPISSMMGFASLVRNYYSRMDEASVIEYLDLIIEAGYKLKEIINGLLLLAGVNKMDEVEINELDMHIVVDDARRRLAALIQERGARINTPREWPSAAGYGPWVEEVWMNYISNALKYGGEPPQIDLGAEPGPDGMVRFWVRDNGKGLTPEEQQRVFTPFTRLEQVKTEGHGLGLSIVQRIVQKLGGEVGVESQVGSGSVFSFTLPASTT